MVVKRMVEAKVRPVSNQKLEKASLAGAARVYVNATTLISIVGAVENGRSCFIEKIEGPDSQPSKRQATLWAVDSNVATNIVQLTKVFQHACGLKLGDSVRITMGEEPIPIVQVVTLHPVDEDNGIGKLEPIGVSAWEYAIRDRLELAREVFPGMVLEGVIVCRKTRSFTVTHVNGQTTSLARYLLEPNPHILVRSAGDELSEQPKEGASLRVEGVAGLGPQVQALNQFLGGFNIRFPFQDLFQSCGLVIHGEPGTGKTFLLERIAATGWGRVFRVDSVVQPEALRQMLELARVSRPSIVLIDQLHELISPRSVHGRERLAVLTQELDLLSADAHKNQQLPSVVVVAACLDFEKDVPRELQKSSRFQENISLPVPSAADRLDILMAMNIPLPMGDQRAADLAIVANRSHAFTPADLCRLSNLAKKNSVWRQDLLRGQNLLRGPDEERFLSLEDLTHALQDVRLSIMDSVDTPPPSVRWKDIGGYEAVKENLKLMIYLSTTTDPIVKSLVPEPPKGYLFYGPPGCSKTLLAQAAATESGFNFFSIKGAEVLNKYVGESERTVRQLFRKARMASPSIIFFDEIDAIGSERGGTNDTNAVNVLTALLTEMDGFYPLVGVVVLAATNRPDTMDRALLRPGRFDECLYVGLPDQPARQAIFEVHLRGVSIAPDVNFAALAARAERNSGAEIKAICRQAGRHVTARYQQSGSNSVVSQDDLMAAIERNPPRTTSNDLKKFETWMSRQYG